LKKSLAWILIEKNFLGSFFIQIDTNINGKMRERNKYLFTSVPHVERKFFFYFLLSGSHDDQTPFGVHPPVFPTSFKRGVGIRKEIGARVLYVCVLSLISFYFFVCVWSSFVQIQKHERTWLILPPSLAG
jgi:hypothetical protein